VRKNGGWVKIYTSSYKLCHGSLSFVDFLSFFHALEIFRVVFLNRGIVWKLKKKSPGYRKKKKSFSSGTLATLPLPPSLLNIYLLQCLGHICLKNEVSSLMRSTFKKSRAQTGVI